MNATLKQLDVESPAKSKAVGASDWRFKKFGLSRQESRVIELAMEGNIDKQVAVEMGISLGTVRVYWKRIRAKTQSTRSESIANLAKGSLQHDYDDLQQRADSLRTELDSRDEIDRRLETYEAAFRLLDIPLVVIQGTGHAVSASVGFTRSTGFEVGGESITPVFADPEKAALALDSLSLSPCVHNFQIQTKDGSPISMKLNACGGKDLSAVLWADA